MKRLFFFFADAAKLALQSVFAHKLRAFLTLIGIIFGVASVVIVGASINGFNGYVLSTVSKILGVNHFMIAQFAHQGQWSEDEWERAMKRNKKLTLEDYEWLSANCTTCKEVGAQSNTRINLQQEGKEMFGVGVFGVTANMVEIENKTIAEGRFLAPHEVEHASLVCVLGGDVKNKFFPGVDAIGKTLKISNVPMTVVGVEEMRGPFMGESIDNHVYIPITTHGKLFGRRQSLQLHGKGSNRESFMAAIEEAQMVMRNRHKLIGNEDDDFGLVNTDALNNQVDRFTGMIALVVTPITLLSLVVGGIVVMNIMLVSVTERTFEIGLRKAVGAKKRQILLQFLIESSLLTGVGGVLGLLLASFLSWVVRITTPVPMNVTFGYILLALLISGGIGMIAGIYPAFKASRLDPIVALSKN
ncbi:MAG: ABC transporter permease [Acidobacteria bacterium]|nr:ABC transporter permease [Acidobacteriota bacterium]